MGDEQSSKQQAEEGRVRPPDGPSSFAMQDADLVFEALALKPGDVFLDLGCGPGNYSLYASLLLGATGRVFALDKWERMITGIGACVAEMGYRNITAVKADLCSPLPVADHCVDVCLMATVMHTLDTRRDGDSLFTEIRRVLKPGGRLAVLNCKKEEQPFGPALSRRFSPEQVEDIVGRLGFQKVNLVEFKYNYLIQFKI